MTLTFTHFSWWKSTSWACLLLNVVRPSSTSPTNGMRLIMALTKTGSTLGLQDTNPCSIKFVRIHQRSSIFANKLGFKKKGLCHYHFVYLHVKGSRIGKPLNPFGVQWKKSKKRNKRFGFQKNSMYKAIYRTTKWCFTTK